MARPESKDHPVLTAAQKTLVQDTFAIITPIADDAAALFYTRLFELDPSLERMFPGDMKEQRKKLMQMLTAAVKGLDRLDQLVPVVEDVPARAPPHWPCANVDTGRAAMAAPSAISNCRRDRRPRSNRSNSAATASVMNASPESATDQSNRWRSMRSTEIGLQD
jgi:hypothetical protein